MKGHIDGGMCDMRNICRVLPVVCMIVTLIALPNGALADTVLFFDDFSAPALKCGLAGLAWSGLPLADRTGLDCRLGSECLIEFADRLRIP